ncbi:MAG: amidohydrolase family protein, partial [Clostridia bacterium]|nr:amidohydrolase family protein [Clostridia bacterium]
EEASQQLCGTENFYVDCSSSFFWLSDDEIKRIIGRYGTGRVLFGSDYPMWSPKAELERFLALGLSGNEKRQILSENAIKVYKLDYSVNNAVE